MVAVTGPGTVATTDGAIACEPACEASFERGTSVVLEADPEERAEFRGWSGSCTGLGRCRLTVDEDRKVSATFAALPDPVLLNVNVSGRGSVVSKPAGIDCPGECSASFARGRTVQLYATAGTGSSLAGWSGGGCSQTTKRRCDVTMNGRQSVTARFRPDAAGPGDAATLRITPSGDGSGTVTGPRGFGLDCPPDCSATFRRGATVELAATGTRGRG